jgi:ferritin
MLRQTIQDALNDQIQAETYSAYLYLSMAAWLDSKSLKGMSHWMRIQTQEENFHAEKLFNYILERGGTVTLQALDAPTAEWASPLAAFQAALAHEEYITGRINALMDLAIAESDHATKSMLQWFVDEQVEEEANASDNVANLTLAADSPQALLMVDKEMAARVFTPPV